MMEKIKRLRYLRISDEQIRRILEILYLLAFALLLGYAFLETTTFRIEWPDYFYSNVRAVLTALVLARIILSGTYTRKEAILAGVITLLFLLCWRRREAEVLLDTLLLILGGKDISFKKILKVYLAVSAGLLLFTMRAALTGTIENLIYAQEGRRLRHSFGICYPTDFSAHVFYSLLAYVCIRGEKIKSAEIAGIGAIGILVYYFCDARANTLCILLLAGVLCYHRFRMHLARKKQKVYEMNGVWSVLLASSAVLCALLMTVLTLNYSPESRLSLWMDRVINSRLRCGKKGVDLFGFHLFGQQIPMQGSGGSVKESVRYFFLDCSYISIVLQYGLLVFGIVLAVCCVLGFRARREKQWILLWVLAIASLQCIMEHHLLEISYYPFLWAAFADISRKKDREMQRSGRRLRFLRERKDLKDYFSPGRALRCPESDPECQRERAGERKV